LPFSDNLTTGDPISIKALTSKHLQMQIGHCILKLW